jgi:hypothetical protein
MHDLVRVIINVVVVLGVRRLHTFVHPEFVQIRTVRPIQFSTAFVGGVGVMISNAFSSQVIIGTHNSSRNYLRARVIDAIVIWLTLVGLGRGGGE